MTEAPARKQPDSQARPRRPPRFRRPRGRWLLVSAAVTVAAAGTAAGLALTWGGPTVPPVYPLVAAFSADSRYLVTAGQNQAQVIDAASGRVLAQWQPETLARYPVDSVGISRNDMTVVTVNDGYVQRWSLAALLAAGVGGHPRPLSAFQALPRPLEGPGDLYDALSPDGTLLAVTGQTGAGPEVLWNTATGRVAAQIGAGGIAGFSEDDRTLALLRDNGIQLFDIAATRPRLIHGIDCGACQGATFPFLFTSDDDVVLQRQAGSGLQLFDAATGKQVAELPQAGADPTQPVSYSPVSGLVAEGNDPSPGWVTVWHAATGREAARLAPPAGDGPSANDGLITRLAFSPDGKTLVVLPGDGAAWLWRVPA